MNFRKMVSKHCLINLLLLIVAVVTLGSLVSGEGPNKVVCYYGSWATYRQGNGQFNVEDIDTEHCTHIIYSFVGINGDGTIKILDTWNELSLGALKRFTNLKMRNPNLKTLIAIGGWNEGSVVFSQVASNPILRANLAASALNFLDTYGFDGFDFDWEYPAQRGGAGADRINFIEMIKDVREKFGSKYLITAAVAATGMAADISYDIPNMSKYLDFINIMAYDFHSYWDKVTGQNAPLYPAAQEDQWSPFNVAASIKAWMDRGAPSEKLVLGLGAYGKSYTLANSNNRGLGAPAINGGTPGKYTRESGILGYMEICELQKEGGWSTVWDNDQKVPYMFKGDQWVGFDNEDSIAQKIAFAKSLKLGGLMLWSIEMEDFRGLCGKKNPLLTMMYDSISSDTPPGIVPTSAPDITSTVPHWPTNKPSINSCQKTGYVRDTNDCAVFYYCAQVGDPLTIRFVCGASLYFNTESNACDYRINVKC